MTNKTNESKKQGRFYSVDELVWVIEAKKKGKVKEINRDTLSMTVEFEDGTTVSGNFWKFDKLKYKEKTELIKQRKERKPIKFYVAKLNEKAVVPSKNDEDAGYDIYAVSDEDIVLEVGVPTLVPTGIAISLPNTHYFNCKHERGSTGKLGMSVLSGVVDSGYRGELFINIVATNRKVILSNKFDEVKVLKDVIHYPLSKAIAQGTVELVPKVEVIEIPYDELKEIPSIRGTGKLDSSNK